MMAATKELEACTSGTDGLHAREVGAGRTLCGVIAYTLRPHFDERSGTYRRLGLVHVKMDGCGRCARSLAKVGE